MSPTLEMSAVSLQIGDVSCVRSLSLTIEPGEMVAVTGRSGAGKSSLINLAAGLQRATEGGIGVCGTSLDGLSENQLAQLRRDHVGLVFQTDNLLPTLTAAENIALALELAGLRANQAMEQAREALHSVDLGNRYAAPPEELSGGERQRVAVARALVGNKSLLLADEPTAALDELTAEVITRLLHLRCEQGASVLLVTHAAGVAAWADRVIHLADGRMQSESTRGISNITLKGVVS